MRDSRDLLIALLLTALVLRVWPRAPPQVGRPEELLPCPVRIEAAGVGCLSSDEARRAGLHSGDRLRLENGRLLRDRMAPARLAAWSLPVNLNRATVEELASLDGVGPKLAERIIAERPFVTIDEISRVRGIGQKRLGQLRERLTILDE